MKFATISFFVTLFLIAGALVSAQSDKKKEDVATISDSLKTDKVIAQWQSVSTITGYMKANGMKKVNNNIDTIFDLLNKRKKKDIVIIYKPFPIYVPIQDSASYMAKMDEKEVYVDTVKKKSLLNKILHR